MPTDINNRGDVTGYFTPVGSAATGFVITSGNLMTFSIPGFPFDTYATGLNDSGDVVGYFNHVSSGFLRHTDGSFETFAFPASGIDNKGIIVGNGSGPNNTAVGMARIGSVNYTLVLPGVADFDVLGINNADEVVGIYGFAPTERIFEGRLSVPEPSTTVPIALMVVAGLVFARVRGQRRLWTH